MESTNYAVPPPSAAVVFENLRDLEDGQIQVLPLSCLVLGAYQPRKHFDPKKLEELAASIRARGVLQPILVRPITKDRFEIVSGERRYLASQRAGCRTIPAVIRTLDDREALEVSLLVNLQRQDLTEIEETEGVLRLLALKLECSVTEVISMLYRMDNEAKNKVTQHVLGSASGNLVESVFTALGKLTWPSFIVTRLPLLKLPQDILEALRAGEITPIKARTVARLTDPTERHQLLEDLVREGWSNQELRQRVAALTVVAAPRDGRIAARLRAFESAISRDHHAWANDTRRERAEALLRELQQVLSEEGLWLEVKPRQVT
jgi:ParB family transcriptional regulator, chromosome partitioning protein